MPSARWLSSEDYLTINVIKTTANCEPQAQVQRFGAHGRLRCAWSRMVWAAKLEPHAREGGSAGGRSLEA